MVGIVDGTEPLSLGLVEGLGGLIIADGVGDGIQLFEGEPGLEVAGGVGQ